MPKVTVEIDTAACITAANCIGIAPQFFQIDAQPYVELVDASGALQGTKYTFEATAKELELLEEAVDSCPTRAIALSS